MATANSTTGIKRTQSEPPFLQTIIDFYPGIIYINGIDIPGDIHSFHNLYVSQPGLDFIGCTKEEISLYDINFFREIVHPDDLELLALSLQMVYPKNARQNVAVTLRIKSKDHDYYSLFHCSKTILETFEDGRLKQILVYASEITGNVHSGNQILHTLKGTGKKYSLLQQYHFTPREKQVLHLIVKGKTDLEIADELIISISTARKHRNNMILKSKVKNSAALVALAVESGGYSAHDKL